MQRFGSDSNAKRRRSLVAAVGLLGIAAALGGCQSDRDLMASANPYDNDYRSRHPISIVEGPRKLEVFIGTGRGSLTPTQRAEVLAFALAWSREGTGGLVIEAPIGTSNERAASTAMREIRSILAAAGASPNAVVVQTYKPLDKGRLATIRIRYPKMTAQAGPCGLWPRDLGPTADPEHFENQNYWNLGCANQRNLAAMVEEPADLVQPRSETPALASRRSTVLDKYRKGESTSTVYSNPDKGTISDVGK